MKQREKRALLSVSDKSGLVPLAQGLAGLGYTLIASGGTARAIRDGGLEVTDVSAVTGSPEVLGGRVKTLHPAIHGGILSRRTEADALELAAQNIAAIDVVVCNLYPFLREPSVEQIDIGGVTLLRAAAKNHAHVTVASDPGDYDAVLSALEAGGATLTAFNTRAAAKAFALTARYDLAIGEWLSGAERVTVALEKADDLRYGENPHQKAAFYNVVGERPNFTQRGGEKALSYNNLVDMDAARAVVSDFDRPTVAIIKHTNPCGLASAALLTDAFTAALESDPVSAFGSIIAVNRPVGAALIEAIGKLYVEVIVAPEFSDDALAMLAKRKKNCRVIAAEMLPSTAPQLRQLNGGWLVQDADAGQAHHDAWRVVTKRAPTNAEQSSLRFAMRVAKHVKSNAIILTRGEATVGVGAGQMSRVDAVHLAVRRAGARSDGAVLASDAFFPFPDGIEAAAAAGVRAVIQPGGSMRDDVVIEAADRLGLAMVMTGVRHFKH